MRLWGGLGVRSPISQGTLVVEERTCVAVVALWASGAQQVLRTPWPPAAG